jgi:hypothetical protein
MEIKFDNMKRSNTYSKMRHFFGVVDHNNKFLGILFADNLSEAQDKLAQLNIRGARLNGSRNKV